MMTSGGPSNTQPRAFQNKAKRSASIGARSTSPDGVALNPTTTMKAVTNGPTHKKSRPSRKARNAFHKRRAFAAAALTANPTTVEEATSGDADPDDEWYNDFKYGAIKSLIIFFLGPVLVVLGAMAYEFVQKLNEAFWSEQPSRVVPM
ncbi:hypothetical protein Q7P36_006383 [Cladosporium allicinum]